MQTFINQKRQTPAKADVLGRLKNFNEIYTKFDVAQAAEQASRCVQCGDPYCSANGCPLSNYIPHWLKTIAAKDVALSFKLSNESSPFPEILGRICPQDKLCEGACTLQQDGYEAITIGSVETAITEEAFARGLRIKFPTEFTDKKVAVVGSGPASMSCANFLLRAGIQVEMFERDDRAGGLLTYGIPGFKLEKDVVQRRFDLLQNVGMKLHTNCEVGKDITIEKLKLDFDAVFIGVGASQSNDLRLEGEDAKGVYNAIDFLRHLQKELFGVTGDLDIDLTEKNVVVIGGGDTACYMRLSS